MFLRIDECAYYGCFLLAPTCFSQQVCRYGQLAGEACRQHFLKHKRKAYLQLQQTAVRAVAAAHAVGERIGERAVDALASHARVVDAQHTVVERAVVALASDAAHRVYMRLLARTWLSTCACVFIFFEIEDVVMMR